MHIVFQQEDISTLAKSFDLDESLRGDIIEIRDDYSVGPLKDIYSEEGIENRKDWWRNVLSGNETAISVDSGYVNDPKVVEDLKEKLKTNEDETAWIWVAPNKHDVSGYFWLMSQLKEFVGRVYVLSLNNLPFINEKGNIFYPINLFEIPPREFLKAKKLARPITASEFELDPDEWTKICDENKMIRTLEGAKKLAQHNEDFYDKYILEFVTTDWQKANKVIQQFLNKSEHTTGDVFVLWRLKQLVLNQTIEASGEIKNIKDFEVKKKGNEEEKNLDEEK
jgi:hypothetical protein